MSNGGSKKDREGSSGGGPGAGRHGVIIASDRIALRAISGHLVSAEGGGGREVVANRTKLGGWEIFRVIEHDGNGISLSVSNGQFVCAEGGGGREVVANRDRVGPWEIFKVGLHSRGRITLRSSGGHLLGAEGGGGREVVANRNVVGPWEVFEVLSVDANTHMLWDVANGPVALGPVAWIGPGIKVLGRVLKEALKTDDIGLDPGEKEAREKRRLEYEKEMEAKRESELERWGVEPSGNPNPAGKGADFDDRTREAERHNQMEGKSGGSKVGDPDKIA